MLTCVVVLDQERGADDGKVKSRGDFCITNCEAGMREKPANLFILVLPCQCRHPIMYVSFSRPSLHTNIKHNTCTHTAFWTTRTCACVMHTGVHRPPPSRLAAPRHATTQLRLAPNDDDHLSSTHVGMNL